jgi:hypothetical protein
VPANDLFCPLYNDDQLVFSSDVKATQENFARFSRKDAEIYPRRHLRNRLKSSAPADADPR